MRKKSGVTYTRREPQPDKTFTKAFRKLNATQTRSDSQRIRVERGASKDPNQETTDPKRWFELEARYDLTRANGRERPGPRQSGA